MLITAFFNTAAIRDFETNTAQIVFASPVQKAGIDPFSLQVDRNPEDNMRDVK